MTAQPERTSVSLTPNKFTMLDVIGISVSTLVFTLVWVGLFSVFLPEKTSPMTQGLREMAHDSEDDNDLLSRNKSLLQAKRHITSGLKSGVTSLLAVIQTGGSAKGMTVALVSHADPMLRVFPDAVVLGAKTQNIVLDSQVPQTIIQQSYVYINTVTFGLLGRLDRELEMAMAPYSLVERV